MLFLRTLNVVLPIFLERQPIFEEWNSKKRKKGILYWGVLFREKTSIEPLKYNHWVTLIPRFIYAFTYALIHASTAWNFIFKMPNW